MGTAVLRKGSLSQGMTEVDWELVTIAQTLDGEMTVYSGELNEIF